MVMSAEHETAKQNIIKYLLNTVITKPGINTAQRYFFILQKCQNFGQVYPQGELRSEMVITTDCDNHCIWRLELWLRNKADLKKNE